MKHLKEPWEADKKLTDKRKTLFVYNEIGVIVAEVFSYRDLDNVNKVFNNANRIVSCVNACAGITNEALEAGYIKHLVEWDEVNHNCIDIVDSVKTPFEFKGVPIKEDV